MLEREERKRASPRKKERLIFLMFIPKIHRSKIFPGLRTLLRSGARLIDRTLPRWGSPRPRAHIFPACGRCPAPPKWYPASPWLACTCRSGSGHFFVPYSSRVHSGFIAGVAWRFPSPACPQEGMGHPHFLDIPMSPPTLFPVFPWYFPGSGHGKFLVIHC